MEMEIRWTAFSPRVLAIALAVSVVCAFPATDAARGFDPPPSESRLAPRWFQVIGLPDQIQGRRWLRIRVEDGYCAGEEPPRFAGVSIIERPRTAARPFASAVIRAYVRGGATASEIAPPPTAVSFCAGLGIGWRPWIRFKRPLKTLFLYDGHSDPPRRVWPPVGQSLREAWDAALRKESRLERRRR